MGMPPAGPTASPMGMGGAPTGSMPGGPPMGGPSASPVPSMEEILSQVAQMIQGGAPPEQVVQFLMSIGLTQEQAMQVIQQVLQMLQQSAPPNQMEQGLMGAAAAAPGMAPAPIEGGPVGMGGPGLTPEALPPESGPIMAGPAIPAIPQNTNPEPTRVGPRTRVSGQASGRAPGRKRQ